MLIALLVLKCLNVDVVHKIHEAAKYEDDSRTSQAAHFVILMLISFTIVTSMTVTVTDTA